MCALSPKLYSSYMKFIIIIIWGGGGGAGGGESRTQTQMYVTMIIAYSITSRTVPDVIL